MKGKCFLPVIQTFLPNEPPLQHSQPVQEVAYGWEAALGSWVTVQFRARGHLPNQSRVSTGLWGAKEHKGW